MNTTTAATSWQEPTADKVAEWKKEFGIDEIHVLKVSDKRDNSIKKAYMRPPMMSDLIRASESNKAKAGTYSQSLFENCVIDCHPDIKRVQTLLQGAIFSMDKIIVAAEVEIEKI